MVFFLAVACGAPSAPPSPPPTVVAPAAVATITDAWIRVVPPGTPNTAGYLTLRNPSAQARELVRATSSLPGTVELHAHIDDNGVMRMQKMAQVPVPAGSEVTFAPGGLHVMFLNTEGKPQDGEMVDVTLVFADGGTVEASVPARKAAPDAHDHAHDHHH